MQKIKRAGLPGAGGGELSIGGVRDECGRFYLCLFGFPEQLHALYTPPVVPLPQHEGGVVLADPAPRQVHTKFPSPSLFVSLTHTRTCTQSIHTHTCIYAHTTTHAHVCTRTMHTCVQTCTIHHMCIHKHTRTDMRTYEHTHPRTHVCTRAHTCVCTHTPHLMTPCYPGTIPEQSCP